ncbi:sn-glycerol-3-phosphate ABC transporter ATP-binding protein UgpC [Rhodophyticola sp. CCM32]|uniref:ABC transporter ATP-binding protein n=1 Tax=Rhodophyticola sp. CCM32 TaxID=2916397 RepID=UPI00107FCBA0|nr:sn-glycerol-3-phosphate ABC transporter ATP-binding protein UgpC [Rhodophyticola sp. CCM32]QBX99930.1 sn-glycerol-3-phosphate ABC transporter ATP-binding protein UgpC [Rhodophyticola sp. CCM32]
MATVKLNNVNKFYGAVQALFNVSLDIDEGSFVVFVGPSGCGKSTLLRAIAGLEGIESGEIFIGDTDVSNALPADRDVSMVFQSYALYPHMSVRANMEFGMKVNGVPPAERKERIEQAARVLQLGDYLDRKPAQLSGGQRQRVAIGRSIVKNPKVFLFDEPLSNLDAKLRIQMRVELEALHRKLDATMIYVTHDQVEAMTMADTIVVLNGGHVEQVGSPLDLYHNPVSRFVAEFIGSPSMNVFAKDAIGDALPMDIGDTVTHLGIRPEHVELTDAATGGLPVTIVGKEELGGESFLYLKGPADISLVAKTDGENQSAIGDTPTIGLPENRVHHFDASGKTIKT